MLEAVLKAADPRKQITTDQRGFLQTESYRGHLVFPPTPGSESNIVIGLVYEKRVSLEGGAWILMELNRSSDHHRELARAMTMLVRPIDLDKDGTYEIHLTQGETHAGYATYKDSVLQYEPGKGYREIFMINSADTSGVIPRHATVDKDNRLVFSDLDGDGIDDMTVMTRIMHLEKKRSRDKDAVLTLTEYEATEYLYKEKQFDKKQTRQIGTVLPQ